VSSAGAGTTHVYPPPHMTHMYPPHSWVLCRCRHNTVFRWAENILTDMKMVRQTLLENGEDVARTSCVRVGLVKSSYKEMSSNILQVCICDMYVYICDMYVCICHIYVYVCFKYMNTQKHTHHTHTHTSTETNVGNSAYSLAKMLLILLDLDLLAPVLAVSPLGYMVSNRRRGGGGGGVLLWDTWCLIDPITIHRMVANVLLMCC
jgi:hypothetical protein